MKKWLVSKFAIEFMVRGITGALLFLVIWMIPVFHRGFVIVGTQVVSLVTVGHLDGLEWYWFLTYLFLCIGGVYAFLQWTYVPVGVFYVRGLEKLGFYKATVLEKRCDIEKRIPVGGSGSEQVMDKLETVLEDLQERYSISEACFIEILGGVYEVLAKIEFDNESNDAVDLLVFKETGIDGEIRHYWGMFGGNRPGLDVFWDDKDLSIYSLEIDMGDAVDVSTDAFVRVVDRNYVKEDGSISAREAKLSVSLIY